MARHLSKLEGMPGGTAPVTTAFGPAASAKSQVSGIVRLAHPATHDSIVCGQRLLGEVDDG